jgi:hypothetical protein
VIALFGSAVYVVLRQQLYASFDKQFLDQPALTLAAVRVEDGEPTLEPSVANVSDGEFFLEYIDDRPVFNVDIGDHDVKVDANSSIVLSVDLDD